MKRVLLAGLAVLSLSACGAKESLAPPQGASLPIKPVAAAEAPTSDDLLKPPSQTRPARSDDLIQSSQERRSDEFDLPPQ